MKKILPITLVLSFVFASSLLFTHEAHAQTPDAFATGLVSLTFDDGAQSIFDNARLILNTAGYKSTQYIISGAMGCADLGGVCLDFMTSSEVNTLKAEGHEIADHTRTDPCPPSPDPDACATGVGSRGLPLLQLLSEIDGLRLDLLQGIGASANTFAYPFGEFDNALVTKLKSAGIVGARTVNFINGNGQPTFNTKSSDRYKLTAVQINGNTPISAIDAPLSDTNGPHPEWGYVEQWIDTAIANKEWLILVFHEILPDCGAENFCITTPKLQAIVSYLQSKSASIVTVKEGLAQMDGNPASSPVVPTITINEEISGAVTVQTSSTSTPVTFTPVVTDDVSSDLGAFCTIPELQYPLATGHPIWGVNFPTVVTSGSVFSTGTTTVTCTSADTDGNIGTHVFNVVVTNNAAPSVTLTTTATDPTSTSSIPVTATFSESVTGLTLGEIVVTNATSSNLTGTSTIYTFDLGPTASGTVTVNIPANSAEDSLGAGNLASNVLSFTYNAPLIVVPPVATTTSTSTTSTTTPPVVNPPQTTTSSASAVADVPVHRTQGQFERGASGGQVLGASTAAPSAVLGESCGLYMGKFIRSGIDNDSEQVMKLQAFLNKRMGSSLEISGIYDQESLSVLEAFQKQYEQEILAPWGISEPTGIVYQTTLRWINMLECPDLSLEVPVLVAWSNNPSILPRPTASVSEAPEDSSSPIQITEPEPESASVIKAKEATGGFWNFIKKLFGS